MRNLFRKKNSQDGAVTIEATIALTAFLFMFIMIYSIVTICRAQATIQVAINSTAKELSQYSYVYSMTGIEGAMSNVADAASGTRGDINDVAGNIAGVFAGIESMGEKAENIKGNFDSVEEDMNQVKGMWGDLEQMGDNAVAAKEKIADMASDPKQVIFGLAKIFAVEGYDTVKSAAAEALSRLLIQKHLVRSEKDTAENFCRSMGILPGTYMGQESYFNGIDFSNSKLYPYGTDEVIIVANYKMKLLQLLPIPVEFHITQKAVTKAWMQGELIAKEYTPAKQIEKLLKNGESIWNTMSGSERERMIRKMGIQDLLDKKYTSVSGETYIHAYDKATNTFVMVRSYNPLAYADSVEEVDRAKIKEYLETLRAQMQSATDNIHTINLKEKDSNGNLVTSEVNCSGPSNQKVVVVIPQDEGLAEIFKQILDEMGGTVEFEILPGYGTVYETPKSADSTVQGDE